MRASKYPGINKWCAANGKTIGELAEMLGYNYATMRNKLSGDRKLSLEEAKHISEVLGIDIDDFF